MPRRSSPHLPRSISKEAAATQSAGHGMRSRHHRLFKQSETRFGRQDTNQVVKTQPTPIKPTGNKRCGLSHHPDFDHLPDPGRVSDIGMWQPKLSSVVDKPRTSSMRKPPTKGHHIILNDVIYRASPPRYGNSHITSVVRFYRKTDDFTLGNAICYRTTTRWQASFGKKFLKNGIRCEGACNYQPPPSWGTSGYVARSRSGGKRDSF